MITTDAYLTGLAKLINVSAVTSLLNGKITKGAKRPDATLYPAITVFGNPIDVGAETLLQIMDGTINIFAASLQNGAADMPTLSAIEAQIIPLVKLTSWSNGNTVCKSQLFRGSFGPFWDPLESDVHFISLTIRSWMVDYT